jgi:hypothetical protein
MWRSIVAAWDLGHLLRRLGGDGLVNLSRARDEVVAALGPGGAVPEAPDVADQLPITRVPSTATRGLGDRTLAEIDHDGFAFAVAAEDEPCFNRRPRSHARQQHQLRVVIHRGRVCVRKEFRAPRLGALRFGDRKVSAREWAHRSLWMHLGLPFYNEVAALLRLRDLPFVPKLRGVDVRSRVLYIDYITGQSLRHHAATSGEPVHDADLPGAGVAALSAVELDRREVALLDRVDGSGYRGEIADMAREINRQGVAPLDIKLGNFLRGDASGRLYWIDFELCRLQSQPNWQADLTRQHQILADLFGL